MNFEEAVKKQNEVMSNQLKSQYSDTEIKQIINDAIGCPPQDAPANALTAMAMILYNMMITRRWR